MKSSRCIFLATACLLVAVPTASRAQWDLSGSTATGGAVYSDPAGRYSLELPKGWSPDTKNGTLVLSAGKSAVTVFHQPGGTDPSGMVSTYALRVKSTANNYTQTDPAPLKVSGMDAQSLTFTGTSPQGVKSRGRIIAATNGTDGLVCILTSPAADYDRDNAALAVALGTLKLGAQNTSGIPGAPAAGSPSVVKLAERTKIKIAPIENLRSGDVKKGEEIRYEVVDDVLGPNRELLIPKGTAVYGTVLRSEGRKMFGKPGKLDIGVESTTAVDGQKVILRTNESLEQRGKSNSGTVAAVSLLVSPVGVFLKGKDVTIKKGTEFTVYVDKDVMVDTSRKPVPSTAS